MRTETRGAGEVNQQNIQTKRQQHTLTIFARVLVYFSIIHLKEQSAPPQKNPINLYKKKKEKQNLAFPLSVCAGGVL